ncbi:MAG: universal stress protein [Deltaproteobacteria bacterium]|jgi:nucleotide-binding universal stress UspA family protein|nr:universal stress protein [Deltaproteobacteria bacterium]
MEKKILVAFDDSENAMRGVEFITKSFTTDHGITLFSVIPDTAAACEIFSPELTTYFLTQREIFCSMQDKKTQLVNEALATAKELLMKAGFAESNISTKVQAQQKGIARDIMDEAVTGYDVIVIGRRGLSAIKEFFLGSVSQKVIHSAGDISVVLVG